MAAPKEYPTLYKQSSSGKIQFWSIKIDVVGEKVFIVTQNGFMGGKSKPMRKQIPKGKAGRTVIEQAELEADSKFRDKSVKSGYVPNLTEVEEGNTKVVRPMLAKKYEANKFMKWVGLPAYAQRKYDGVRCLAHRNSKDAIILETRQGLPISGFEHIRTALTKLYNEFSLADSFYFDGELYTMEIPFQILNGLIRLETANTEQLKMQALVSYYVYDCFDLQNMDSEYTDRLNTLRQMFRKERRSLVMAPTEVIDSQDDIKTLKEKFIEEGFEGLIIRNETGKYELNKRSSNLLKVKDTEDAEFKIVGFKEGTGKAAGNVIWEVEDSDGKRFDATQVGPFDYRQKLFNNAAKYIGKMITVYFEGRFEDGTPRHPRAKAVREFL